MTEQDFMQECRRRLQLRLAPELAGLVTPSEDALPDRVVDAVMTEPPQDSGMREHRRVWSRLETIAYQEYHAQQRKQT